jgi:hypothetical protein
MFNGRSARAGLGAAMLLAPVASAQWWWPPTNGLSVAPVCLDPSTTVQLTLSGDWHDACIPNMSSVQVTGTDIDFTTIREPPPGICAAVITPWSLTEQVGPLAPATYTVYATHMAGGVVIHPRTLVGRFEVVASCGGCYANCDSSTTVPILNITDFACFLNRFAAGETYANCDRSTTPPVLNIVDFACFLNAFAAGCT